MLGVTVLTEDGIRVDFGRIFFWMFAAEEDVVYGEGDRLETLKVGNVTGNVDKPFEVVEYEGRWFGLNDGGMAKDALGSGCPSLWEGNEYFGEREGREDGRITGGINDDEEEDARREEIGEVEATLIFEVSSGEVFVSFFFASPFSAVVDSDVCPAEFEPSAPTTVWFCVTEGICEAKEAGCVGQ